MLVTPVSAQVVQTRNWCTLTKAHPVAVTIDTVSILACVLYIACLMESSCRSVVCPGLTGTLEGVSCHYVLLPQTQETLQGVFDFQGQ